MFFISGHSGVLVNARGNIDRFRAMSRSARHDKRGEIWMSVIAKSKNRMQITEFPARLSQHKRALREIQGM